MRAISVLALSTLVATSASCATPTTGVPIARSDVGALQRGVTEKAEIRERFGEPALVQIHEDGTSTWGYLYETEVINIPGGRFTCRIPVLNIAIYLLGGCVRTRLVNELIVDFTADDRVARIDFYEGTEGVDVQRPVVVTGPQFPVPIPVPFPRTHVDGGDLTGSAEP